MQHVKAGWLRIFNYVLVGLTGIFFAVYYLFEALGVSEETKATWGITPSILTIGAVYVAYVIFIYTFINKRFTWVANLVSLIIYALLFAGIIDTSGNTNLVYRLGYVALVFFMGMNGPFPPLLAGILTWVMMVFSYAGLTTPTNASVGFNFIINVLVSVAGFMGWYIFKRWYVVTEASSELESMLKQEQLKSNTILESITDGVIIMNTHGIVQSLNASAATMLGWEQKEAENLDYKSLVTIEPDSEKAQVADAISQCIQTGRPEQKVSLLSTRHNRQFYVDIVASPLFRTTENPETYELTQKIVGVIAVLRDVDAQKRQEQQRSDFISTASHEMRTPVASIQGFLELALNPKVANVDPKAKEYLEKAYEATKHLGSLFQDLLTVSKTEDGRLANNPEIIEVGEFLQELVEQEKPAAAKKGLQLSYARQQASRLEISLTPLVYVNVDAERLREVILNLIENSIKYTPTGMITVGCSPKKQGVVIRVADTGIGIAEEDIPHLFQKFYRTDNSATREIGGTGLGLYISKQITESMGGKIWVESKLKEGSTFYVEIPRVSPERIAYSDQT